MDQLRTALHWLQRYHFWVLSVVVVAIAVGCWYSAAGALSKNFQANQATIKREFDSQANLARQQFHPNERVNDRQQNEIKKQAESVLNTWETLYKRQRDEVLKWPQELDENFRKRVGPLKFGDEISGNLRDHYFNYIRNHFPELPKKVGARVLTDGERGGRVSRSMYDREAFGPEALGLTGARDEADDDKYLVEWKDQANVRQELQWAQRPTALQIWVTQENLWVYHTLLQIIADTNEGADRRSNAKVRVIESLEVGRAAAQASNSSGRLLIPQASTTGPRMGGMEEFMGGGPEMGASTEFAEGRIPSAGMGMMGDLGGGDERAQLLSYRYLDRNGQPIVVAGPSAGPTEFGVEFKRLPVRMVLQMDQRAIPSLIANCANQPLQVEVQQVQVNPAGGSGSGSRRPDFGGTSSGIQAFEAQPNIATVVIHGIIYIINEPNTTTLQIAGT